MMRTKRPAMHIWNPLPVIITGHTPSSSDLSHNSEETAVSSLLRCDSLNEYPVVISHPSAWEAAELPGLVQVEGGDWIVSDVERFHHVEVLGQAQDQARVSP